jgi:hypothetical protein
MGWMAPLRHLSANQVGLARHPAIKSNKTGDF